MVRSLVLVSGFSYGGDPRMRLQFDLWLHLAQTDKIALAKLLLISSLSREFLSAFDENTIDGIIQSFVAMSDWPLIEQNIRVDLALDVREQAKKIKAPTLSITGKYDQIVPPFYTQELADLIPAAISQVEMSALLRLDRLVVREKTSVLKGFRPSYSAMQWILLLDT
jgi:pimeloyl-ACP methyl ester carboxylesterase